MTALLDLTPLVAHFERELQRERDRALTAQSSERSARELVVELEAKLEAMTAKVDEWRVERQRDVGKLADMERQRDHAKCDAAEAQRMLLDERSRHAPGGPR